MDFMIVQLIGAIGYAIFSVSYFKKQKKDILFLQIISYIMFTTHFYLLSGVTGALCNLCGLLSLLTIYLNDKYKIQKKSVLETLLVLMILVVNIITFQNIYSIFPIIASIIAVLSFITDSEELIRKVGFIATLCWLVYAIAYKSYVSIIFQTITLASVTIAYIKNKK